MQSEGSPPEGINHKACSHELPHNGIIASFIYRVINMRRRLFANIAGYFLLLGLSGLVGCGQIGPLYLPEAEPVSDPNAPVASTPMPVHEQSKPVESTETDKPST